MIDTIRVESPSIGYSVYEKLKSVSVEKLQIDHVNDLVNYSFTNCNLEGSFDYRIMINVKTERWQRFYSAGLNKFVTELLPCDPYLVCEFSIHKFFVGHNIKNGFDDLREPFKKFVSFLSDSLDVVLPDSDYWVLTRLDYALTFKLDIDMFDYFNYIKNCSYPRRKTFNYDTSVMWAGSSTTVRIYSKEHEFKEHDLKRLKNNLNFDIIDLVNSSKNMIRCEVQIRKKKLKDLNLGDNMLIKDYDVKKVIKLYDAEVIKIFRNKEENLVYNNVYDVLEVLKKNYSTRKANSLFALYTQLQMFKEGDVKKNMSKATFYRNKKELEKLGIDIKVSNLKVDENFDYKSFIPDSNSKYLVS